MSNADLNNLARLARDGKLAKLDPKERAVVTLRLGWDRPNPAYRSQTEVGTILGWTQAYVSQLEGRARERLEERVRLLAPTEQWWTDPDEVWSMGSWLVHEFRLTEPSEIVYYFEKPWKWDDERADYLADREAEDAKVRA